MKKQKIRNLDLNKLDMEKLESELFTSSGIEEDVPEINQYIKEPASLESTLFSEIEQKADIEKTLKAMYFALVDDLGKEVLEIDENNPKKTLKGVRWVKKNLKLFLESDIKKLDKTMKNKLATKLFLKLCNSKYKFEEERNLQRSIESRELQQRPQISIKTLKKELKKNLPYLINLVTQDLGLDIFKFTSRKDPKVKEIADLIFRYLTTIIDPTATYQEKKELTTFCVIEIIKHIKGKDFLARM